MVTLDEYGFTRIFLLVFCFRPSNAYIKRCPEMVELVLYSKEKCNNHYEYHCLALHRIAFNNYKEECRTPEWVSLGNYAVLRGRYIDYETCPVFSYQPFLFRSNERHKCTYLKSMCSSDGQVEVNDGTTTRNIACRCDFMKGFAFVIRPQNHSACIPSQEDCSCYSKRCAEKQTLNPDYECKTISVLHKNSTNHVVTVKDEENTSHDVSFVVTYLNNVVSEKEGHVNGLIGLTFVISFVILFISAFSLASFIYPLEHLTTNTQSSQGVYKKTKKQEMNQKTARGIFYKTADATKENEHLDMKIHEIDINKGNKDKETAARKNIVQSNVGILEIDQQRIREHKENNLMKTETDLSTPTEKADIVILHTKEESQKQEVADFKSQLERISYYGIRYHLFEELFPLEQYNSGIDIQTVLGNCNFIFVYISKDYVPSKIKRFGLKESSINDALGATKTKNKIKKLSDCESWNMPADKHLSSSDFDFYKFDYKSKDSIKKYQSFLVDILKKD